MFDFEVKLAQNQQEIEKALRLRFEVFREEAGLALQTEDTSRMDTDDFDRVCDHLIVIDKTIDRVVGTYRLLLGSRVDKKLGFYSEKIFNINNIKKLSNDCEIAELGRSCIHRDYRSRPVINLLWNGIAKYIKDYNVRYLFGATRLLSNKPEDVSRVFKFITERFYAASEYRVYAKPGYKFHGLQKNVEVGHLREIIPLLPPLIKGYLRAGVKVCGLPVVNPDFGTVLIFILLDVENMSRAYKRHFL